MNDYHNVGSLFRVYCIIFFSDFKNSIGHFKIKILCVSKIFQLNKLNSTFAKSLHNMSGYFVWKKNPIPVQIARVTVINWYYRIQLKDVFLKDLFYHEQVKDSITLLLKWPIVANTYSAGFTKDYQRPLEWLRFFVNNQL